MGGSQHCGDFGYDAIIDDGLGGTAADAPGHLSEIARTDVELLCIECHVGVMPVILFYLPEETTIPPPYLYVGGTPPGED